MLWTTFLTLAASSVAVWAALAGQYRPVNGTVLYYPHVESMPFGKLDFWTVVWSSLLSILVTGGAGFIGSNFVNHWLGSGDEPLVNLDKLTYAGNLGSLAGVADHPAHHFVRGDIGDDVLVASLLLRHAPRAIVHFAAESHVDRSIAGPEAFIDTNIVGMSRLLRTARDYWENLPSADRDAFLFVNVSTDEVFGSLGEDDPPFTESSPYAPNSPYSASKAAADHLARAYCHSYGLPVITTHCSNNYGPYQFPEKLIPLMILNGLQRDVLPLYGDGLHVRDWLYVEDHCDAMTAVIDRGKPGAVYNIGGDCERANLDVVNQICALLDELHSSGAPHGDLVELVDDRPGHDRRYAIDATIIHSDLGWRPTHSFESGLRKTVEWYLANGEWIRQVTSGEYRDWIDLNYGDRKRMR